MQGSPVGESSFSACASEALTFHVLVFGDAGTKKKKKVKTSLSHSGLSVGVAEFFLLFSAEKCVVSCVSRVIFAPLFGCGCKRG